MSYVFVAAMCLLVGGVVGYFVGRKNPAAAAADTAALLERVNRRP